MARAVRIWAFAKIGAAKQHIHSISAWKNEGRKSRKAHHRRFRQISRSFQSAAQAHIESSASFSAGGRMPTRCVPESRYSEFGKLPIFGNRHAFAGVGVQKSRQGNLFLEQTTGETSAQKSKRPISRFKDSPARVGMAGEIPALKTRRFAGWRALWVEAISEIQKPHALRCARTCPSALHAAQVPARACLQPAAAAIGTPCSGLE